ncbi:MAG: PD-(D/E)XK nuclease family protein [Oscillospiraceae bacterium]|nr:PD-(D/E)XK nuclease family protein [Oscillospiraceae bacterium]
MLNITYNTPITHLLTEIGSRAERGEKKQILLVPEPLSHETERLLQGLGDHIGMSAEVLTFQRIAHRALLNFGGIAEPRLDAGGRLLLLARAVGDVRPHLREWGRVAGNVSFLTELLTTLDELKMCEVRPEMLTGSAKLEDLRLIWDAFEAHAAQTAADPRDVLSRVGEFLSDRGTDNSRLYIDGFVSFTAQEYGIVKSFLKHGDVTVSLPAAREGEDEDIFFQPRKTAERLKRCAAMVGADVREDTPVYPYDKGEKRVYSCPDILTECEWAAKLVKSWLAEDNAPPLRRDEIVVVSPAWEAYKSVLIAAFARNDIPIFTDDMTPVTDKSAARFITSSLDAALYGFEADDVAAFVKTGLAPIAPDECFILEDYIKVHNARGVFWTADKPWTAHPAGWGEREFSDFDKARLETLNRVREKIRKPLLRLTHGLSKHGTGEDFAKTLYNYCTDMELADTLAKRCESLVERGMDREADEQRQLWGVIVKALDNFVDILGENILGGEEFARLFGLCLSQYDVGVIPITLDRVRLCSLDRLYGRNVKRLIIVGANDGVLPKRVEAGGLLTDTERVMLEENGIFMTPGADERASRELYTAHMAFGLAGEHLAVSYCTAGKAEPSMLVARMGLEAATVERPQTVGGGVWHSDRTPLDDWKPLLPPSGALSASRIESYGLCRWAYFSRYALKIRTRGSAAAPAPKDAGSLIHSVLEYMVGEVMSLGGFSQVEREDALKFAAEAADKWLASLPGSEYGSARILSLTSRLKRSAVFAAGNVYDELRVSDFEPLKTEYRFTSGGQVPITGIIDRIDGWIHEDRLYLRVVDYKTGQNKFSLRDVWYGLGMQMLCYLFALNEWEGRKAEAAGVLYLPAHDRFAMAGTRVSGADVSRELRAMLKRSGIILNNAAVINAMENGEEKLYIPVKLKRDGEPDARSQVADAARLGLLRRHVESMMGALSENITNGLVDANPICDTEPQCERCDFAESCYFDENDTPRFMERVDFWEKAGEKYAKAD